MTGRAWATLAVAAVASASVWALSPWLTGHPEPWDADSLFYPAGLTIAGLLGGLLRPRPLWAHYAGAVAGQALYELVFLAVGPLFVLGVPFLLGYSIVFVVAAAVGARLQARRQRRLQQRAAGPKGAPRENGGEKAAAKEDARES